MHGVRDLQARDAGRPFVGPAGRLLDEALIDAGLDRRQLYITNVVKHFKWKAKEGTRRRIHDRPLQDEVEACRPWFQQELSLIRPRLIVCLGATAATAVLGRPVAVRSERGRALASLDGVAALVTGHPSAILRIPTRATRRLEMRRLAADLRAATRLASLGGSRTRGSMSTTSSRMQESRWTSP
jgi:DNA polymerase